MSARSIGWGHTRRWAAVGLATSLLGTLAACGGDDGGGGGDNQLTVWTLDNLPDRMAAQREIVRGFTEETGIRVRLVGVAEDQYSQLLTSAAAAGELPDVIGALSLAGVRELAVNDLHDADTAAAVIEELGEDTFAPQSLELTRDTEGEQLAVPSDGWAQLLVYRKDLFDEAGLPAPETYDDIMAAAEELDSDNLAGFVGANIPNDVFTEQTFEHLALGNGCELVTEEGEITLDQPECVEAFDFYGELQQNYSVPGAQDVDTTRATYFAGEAAMVVWSSFILDEMAGLRNDAMPTCPECRDDPAYLAKNSGLVTAIQGPSGDQPALYGEVVSWATTAEANTDAAQQFITYMMSTGYVDWIGFAPEGKIPTRQGTQENPSEYIDAWEELPAGVDTKAPLSDFYSADVLEEIRTAPEQIQRWAVTKGQGGLLGALLSETPVAQSVNAVATGEMTGEEAAQQADQEVTEIQDSLQ